MRLDLPIHEQEKRTGTRKYIIHTLLFFIWEILILGSWKFKFKNIQNTFTFSGVGKCQYLDINNDPATAPQRTFQTVVHCSLNK